MRWCDVKCWEECICCMHGSTCGHCGCSVENFCHFCLMNINFKTAAVAAVMVEGKDGRMPLLRALVDTFGLVIDGAYCV